MLDASAITVWRFEDAPPDLRALTERIIINGWIALVPRTYADRHDLWWLEHIDKTHDPEMHAHPSLSEYMVWIGASRD